MRYIEKYFVDGGCLTGKQSGAISVPVETAAASYIYLPSRAHPVQRKRRPRLRRIIAIPTDGESCRVITRRLISPPFFFLVINIVLHCAMAAHPRVSNFPAVILATGNWNKNGRERFGSHIECSRFFFYD